MSLSSCYLKKIISANLRSCISCTFFISHFLLSPGNPAAVPLATWTLCDKVPRNSLFGDICRAVRALHFLYARSSSIVRCWKYTQLKMIGIWLVYVQSQSTKFKLNRHHFILNHFLSVFMEKVAIKINPSVSTDTWKFYLLVLCPTSVSIQVCSNMFQDIYTQQQQQKKVNQILFY